MKEGRPPRSEVNRSNLKNPEGPIPYTSSQLTSPQEMRVSFCYIVGAYFTPSIRVCSRPIEASPFVGGITVIKYNSPHEA